MSLIIEALKRARDDAVRRQTASRGLPLAPVYRLKGRNRWLTLALVPLAAALVVCILLLIDLYSRLPEPPATVEGAAAASSPADPVTESLAPPPAAGDSAIAAQVIESIDEGSPRAVPRSSPAGVQAPPPPTRQSSSDSSVAPEIEEVQAPARPRQTDIVPAPTVQSPLPQPTREFVGQAQLRDGQLVDLGGIAWSESEPFALLNGQVIGVGELIRSYRVTEIDPDQVILEQDDDRVVLRLK